MIAQDDSEAMGVVTLIYDHHAGRIAERLTELQHLHLDRVVTTTHVHLDARRCLEVILLRGPARVDPRAGRRPDRDQGRRDRPPGPRLGRVGRRPQRRRAIASSSFARRPPSLASVGTVASPAIFSKSERAISNCESIRLIRHAWPGLKIARIP